MSSKKYKKNKKHKLIGGGEKVDIKDKLDIKDKVEEIGTDLASKLDYIREAFGPMCIGINAINAVIGTLFGILLIAYDYSNPNRDPDKATAFLEIINWFFYILLLANIAIPFLRWVKNMMASMLEGRELSGGKSKMKGGDKNSWFKNIISNFRVMFGIAIQLFNLLIFYCGYLYINNKPEQITSMLTIKLSIIIIFILLCLFIYSKVANVASDLEKKKVWWPIPWVVRHISELMKTLLFNEEKIIYIIQGIIVLLLFIFGIFSSNSVHSGFLTFIKLMYLILLFVLCIVVDGILMVSENPSVGLCMDIYPKK